MRRQIPNAGYSSTNYRGARVLHKRERLHYNVPGNCALSFAVIGMDKDLPESLKSMHLQVFEKAPI
jgi:hypothetical protein